MRAAGTGAERGAQHGQARARRAAGPRWGTPGRRGAPGAGQEAEPWRRRRAPQRGRVLLPPEPRLLPPGVATSAPLLREGSFRSGAGAQRAGRWSPGAAAAPAAAAPRDSRSARAAAATAGTERAAPPPSNAAAPAARPRREAARRPPRSLRPPGGGEAWPPPPRPPRRRFPAPARPSAGLGSRAMAGR
ncbi:atherin-like [Corvus hawaiiensis]|uniref:atherin-like n=1 Tax=Corvus hawaiiensis TaxID=134902 RepID=UPI00201910AF|nr:atherin-like [Corvus hawaiiensis]